MSLASRSFLRASKFRTISTQCVCIRQRALASSAASQLLKTGLYDFHISNGAKMVPFAGYSMPLAYGDVGAVSSHNHVRTKAGLFDVGHMVQSNFIGPTATEFLEWLTPSALGSLNNFSSTLSVLLNDKGGILDDLIICKHAQDAFYVVTNAGRRTEDLAWFEQKLQEWNSDNQGGSKGKVEMKVMEDWGLVALQGPEAATCLQQHVKEDLTKLLFGQSMFAEVAGVKCHIARGGYTGEDGFEISIPPQDTVMITELLTNPAAGSHAQLTGLGARDSLRLEAGMCLYGHDLSEDITPVEAGLSWVIAKSRRHPGAFIGSDTILQQLKDGPTKRRVGFIVEDAPAREGAKIFSADSQKEIGVITSGIPSPTLSQNIAMGYVYSGHHKKGTEVLVDVRKKLRKAIVQPMPFVPTKYWKGTL
ncbi:Aminomethyltransferase, mitochondrial [Tulasnella sp. JGI-2019a]|nr:Aminomethyltransferase, mitochondrial [Tulasnella sp. JGI-2019a]KAG9016485.1 Aminomethyltransferase, mitochondrial [Tulasnella sp. JGI-2019a]